VATWVIFIEEMNSGLYSQLKLSAPPCAAGLQAAPAGEGGAQEPGVRRGRRGLLGRAGAAGRREKAV